MIWDITASAYAINEDWLTTYEAPSPHLNDGCTWSSEARQRAIRYARSVNRDAIFGDFFLKARNSDR